MSSHWICAQLGAREHYAIARALHQSGDLDALLTDAWVPPGSVLSALHPSLAGRYHPDLATASVTSWNASLLAFELTAKARRLTDWPLTMSRNRWFQRRIVSTLASLRIERSSCPTFFAYSYSALEAFRFAKKHGWKTVLGQIDPGPEERLIGKLHRQNTGDGSHRALAPKEYWMLWREECALADHIVVNSTWSRTALVEAGIAEEKIVVVPLAFKVPAGASEFKRDYPEAFTKERPLRVLFLGQVSLRKGMGEALEAMRILKDSPIEFSIVGKEQMEIPSDLRANPRIRWIGPVPRSSVSNRYQRADVFLFPTLSDGFGMTQLEAQAWKLPVIASRFCGDVVEHGRNGWLLSEVSGKAISERLSECVRHPELLVAAAAESGIAPRYSLSSIGSSLTRLVNP